MADKLIRPELKGIKPEIVDYIQSLEKTIEGYRDNGAVQFMAALNRQLIKIAEQIDVATIDFTKSEDRMYERFLNTAKLGKDLTADFKAFLSEYGDALKEEESNKNSFERLMHANTAKRLSVNGKAD